MKLLKLITSLFLFSSLPLFSTTLHLSSVKQVVYMHDADTEAKMKIIDVPYATAYAAPECYFSAISMPFVPPTDGSWKNPSDINLASLYKIKVSGTYKENAKDVLVTIDITHAKVPKDYPFTVRQVTEKLQECVKLMYPYDPKLDSKLEIKIIQKKLK